MATADWLTAQRWFRSKARAVSAVTVVDRLRLTDAADLAVVEVAYADGGPTDRYLLPRVDGREPADGEGAWRALVAVIAAGGELRGEHGRLRGDPAPALAELLPSPREAVAALDERRLGVEQSNTSVVLGRRLILKLYRVLEPGGSPDLEVGAFLGRAGFAETPALAGSATYLPATGPACAAAMLQAYLPARGDAWAELLRLLASDPPAATRAAGRIGGLTRRLHDALASRPDDPAFPARVATPAEAAAWRAGSEGQLAAAIDAVGGEQHDRLVRVAPALRARFADAFGRAGGAARVTRIHGDYHLGQLLAGEHGFAVIDFEGEPARPLAERRAPSSPLRDVAGMLRSLDYAARTADRGDHAAGFQPEAWLDAARAAFLGGYGALTASDAALVEAFELEKACYEVRYEANNRPDWLWLPLGAIERLAGVATRG